MPWKRPWWWQTFLKNTYITVSTLMCLTSSIITFFFKCSVITSMCLQSLNSWRFSIKSINISCQHQSGMGNSFSNLWHQSFHTMFAWHLLQFHVKHHTSAAHSGQQNCCDSIANVASYSECPVITESCVSCMIWVLNNSESGTQSLPQIGRAHV